MRGRRTGRRATLRLLAAPAIVVAGVLAAGCTPAPARPNADWQMQYFDSGSGNSVLSCADAPGPRLQMLLGAGPLTRQSERVDGAQEVVLAFGQGGGLSLRPTTGEAGSSTYSIVVLFRLATVTDWRRLVDFKDGTSDTGLYLDGGQLSFYTGTGATTGSRAVASNEYVQVVLTRTSGGTLTAYVDGVQQWQFTDTSGLATIGTDQLVFFRDNVSGGSTTEHSAGAVARIRVFDRALPATDVRNLGQTPGTPCAPEERE